MMDINMDLLQWFINLLIKNIQKNNEKLAKELHKPIIRESGKRKIHSVFTENIWGTDLTDIQLISKVNIGFRFLLFLLIFQSKYAWVIPLKDIKAITITNTFQQNLNESKRKRN